MLVIMIILVQRKFGSIYSLYKITNESKNNALFKNSFAIVA